MTVYLLPAAQLRHPHVGDFDLTFRPWTTPSAPNQVVVTYTVEQGSPSADALNLLGSMAAMNGPRDAACLAQNDIREELAQADSDCEAGRAIGGDEDRERQGSGNLGDEFPWEGPSQHVPSLSHR